MRGGWAVGAVLWGTLCCNKGELVTSRAAAGDKSAPSSAARQRDPADENYQMPQLPRARVVLHDVYGGAHAFDAEVAESEEARTRGMMWRTQLARDKAMLFIFPDEQVRSFWMRNTLIPLDMIFISADKKIVGIVAEAAPKTLTSRSVPVPAKYVLEVAGGWSERAGVRAGSQVEIDRG